MASFGGPHLTPADIDPGCPVNVNVFSPYTAGYSGRVTRVLADGTTETVADNLPSMTDVTGVSYGPTDLAFVGGTLYVLTTTSAPSATTAGRRSSRSSTSASRVIGCRSTRPIRSSASPGAATGSTASRSSRPTSNGPPTTRT